MDEDQFLQKICENLDDDTPRLIYADWLEENGQSERAEFIRIQCELANSPDDLRDERLIKLRDREWELQEKQSPGFDFYDWARRSLRDNAVVLEWHRGFPHTFGLAAKTFLKKGGVIHQKLPTVRRLALFDLNGWAEKGANCPTLSEFDEIELACWYEDSELETFVKSPHLKQLRWLSLWDLRSEALARTVGGSQSYPELRELQLVFTETRGFDWRDQHQHVANAVDESAGRKIAQLFNPFDRPYRLTPANAGVVFVGVHPDGRQIAAFLPGYDSDASIVGEIYNESGLDIESVSIDIPEGRLPEQDQDGGYQAGADLIREKLGFEPAPIVVWDFDTTGYFDVWISDPGYISDGFGRYDNPDDFPGDAIYRLISQGAYTLRYSWPDRDTAFDRYGRCLGSWD